MGVISLQAVSITCHLRLLCVCEAPHDLANMTTTMPSSLVCCQNSNQTRINANRAREPTTGIPLARQLDFGSRWDETSSRDPEALVPSGMVGPLHGKEKVSMKRVLLVLLILFLAKPTQTSQERSSARDFLIARAKSLELDTPYVPPPGNPLEHHASGFAKVMCSAVFITGLDPDFAAENVGFFTAPYAVRSKLGKPVIDRGAKAVHVTVPNGTRRTAKHFGSQGCVTLPIGHDSPAFTPVAVKSQLPDAATQPWPMGDVLPAEGLPPEINAASLKQAINAAFEPAALTAAFVVTWKGRLIGERYGEGITLRTPLEGWSMAKSLTATLMGILVKEGVYDLW